jgi:PPOX class probable F420-dependent enzyme
MSIDLAREFQASVCMNVRSFRRDGTPVDTPLWVIADGERFASYTDDRSFKAKRIRRNPRVEVAACDVFGRCSTPWYPARCSVVEDPAERERLFARIREKYGIHWKLSLWGSLLTNRVKHRMVLQFELLPGEPLWNPAAHGFRAYQMPSPAK